MKKMKKLLLAVLVLSSSIFASTFQIDATHSKVVFKVKHMAITNTYGTFSDYNAKKFPKINFKLLEISDDEAIAELIIKGITKKVTFDLENSGVVKDPWGNTKLGLSLETKISRKAFGLTWNKLL
jgi:polyisoprenoid-binding protein YceI